MNMTEYDFQYRYINPGTENNVHFGKQIQNIIIKTYVTLVRRYSEVPSNWNGKLFRIKFHSTKTYFSHSNIVRCYRTTDYLYLLYCTFERIKRLYKTGAIDTISINLQQRQVQQLIDKCDKRCAAVANKGKYFGQRLFGNKMETCGTSQGRSWDL